MPRAQLRAASRLDLVNVNLSRAIGPALAGLVIAHLGGVHAVFTLNAVSVVFLAIAVLLWRRRQPELNSPRERFVPALRAGGRYVWHDPVVRRILLRLILFVTPAVALWALLPLIATQRLGLGADGYGVLFAALGLGARSRFAPAASPSTPSRSWAPKPRGRCCGDSSPTEPARGRRFSSRPSW